jgi:nucleotide-binding universal stress UspA family protein
MHQRFSGYPRILAATDFSPSADAALWRAVWIGQQTKSHLVVAHVVSDLRRAVSRTSYRSRIEFLEGQEEHFQRELRAQADAKLKRSIANLGDAGLEITYETLLGEPLVELIHAVQQEKYDLVVAGTRGHNAWKRLVLGSTAKRLIRKCPASVWIVKREGGKPPTSIVAAVDLSEVSGKALDEAIWVARRAGAKLHVLHVIEAHDIPPDQLSNNVIRDSFRSLRESVEIEAKRQFHDFLADRVNGAADCERHLLWGSPWQETVNLTNQLHADLIVLGTVGRSGIQGLLLGNTAENVLIHCDCDVLTVKPAGFVSPIAPPTWPLHPGPEKGADK